MKTTAKSNWLRSSLSLLCALSASSALATSWETPTTLGAPKASWVATGATNQKGDAVAAWLQTDTVPYKVYASVRKAGSLTFGTPSGVSGRSTSNPYPIFTRVDGFHNSFVVWEDQGAVYGAIRIAPANRWGPSQVLAPGASLAGFELDRSGNATILVGTTGAVQIIDRPAGGSWSAPQTIASHTNIKAAGLAIADDGGAVAIWETYDKSTEYFTNFVLHASRRMAWNSSWGPAADLSVPLTTHQVTADGHSAVVAMDPKGNTVVVGRQLDNDPSLTLGAVTSSADSDTWSAFQLVTAAGALAGDPSVAVDGSGFATLVWTEFSSGGVKMATARVPTNVWTPPLTISEPGVTTGYPLVGTNRAGVAAVT